VKACAACGDSRRLRFDRERQRWECAVGCGETSKPRRRRPVRPPALFEGFWRDAAGHRRARVSRDELRELHRLWVVHRDIREGQAIL
jgi:hypothetical protein